MSIFDLHRFDMGIRSAPETLTWGRFQVNHARRLDLQEIVLHVEEDFSEHTCTLSGIDKQHPNDLPLVNLNYFRDFPQNEQYESMMSFWTANKKKWVKMPEGMRFENHMLAPKHIPDGWEHDTILHRGRSISHVYHNSQDAMVIRFVRNKGMMLELPLYQHITEHLVILDDTSAFELPVFGCRSDVVKAVESSMPQTFADEIKDCIRSALDTLGLPVTSSPEADAIDAIHQFVLKQRRSRHKATQEEIDKRAIEFGCLWGEVVCNTRHWQWVMVEYPGVSEPVPSIVSEDRAFAIAPINLMHDVLSNPNREDTGLLLYNMLEEPIGSSLDRISKAYTQLQ